MGWILDPKSTVSKIQPSGLRTICCNCRMSYHMTWDVGKQGDKMKSAPCIKVGLSRVSAKGQSGGMSSPHGVREGGTEGVPFFG